MVSPEIDIEVCQGLMEVLQPLTIAEENDVREKINAANPNVRQIPLLPLEDDKLI